ncbi:MAG: TRAP transporter fused permease subunit [Pseudomonadota bacterium]
MSTETSAQAGPNASPEAPNDRAGRAAFALGLGLVAIGMVNNIPSIPGLDAWAVELAGDPTFAIRKFEYQYLYPLAFVLMMVIVALRHAFARSHGRAGLAMDLALVVMAVAVALTYLIEIDAVCLIDQITGERAELLARSLKEEQEFAELYGLPIPDTVDDPQCLNTTGVWLFAIVGAAIAVFLGYNIKVWSLPLVLVAILIALYTLATITVWYFLGAEDINKYLVTKLGGEPRQLIDGRPKVHDILVNNASGLLGQFMGILLNTVFPYIVLGALFGASAGGRSLIKIAFRWTRRLRGGPAHAAIVSSAFFGTISGGPVVNVLSTGVLTIPMMLRRGFNKVFAGGMEAAASSGGQIMPPVMGVAAFVLASLTLVPYREVIIAAIIPAIAYFGCLFLSVVFQARKQGIEAVGAVTEEMHLTGQDRLNLAMIFGPILLILILLLTPKEAVGCGWVAFAIGIPAEGCVSADLPWLLELVQNSAGDAGSAGWWAVLLLIGLLFLDPEVRAQPAKIVRALSEAGVLMSTLYLMFLAVSVIDFCLNFTGLSTFIAHDILGWLRGLDISAAGAPVFLFLALMVTMLLAILLGMGMPTVPAYINVALLMGPMLAGLGIATFTAHMFIFYFAVASAITPPVAIAAFAASTITRAEPMATGFSAVRSGVVMFVIPFVFAFYPELLLIDAALIDPNSGAGGNLPGYEDGAGLLAMIWLIARLVLALYLLASALAAFDRGPLGAGAVALRLALAGLVMTGPVWVHGPTIAAVAGMLALHYGRREVAAA